jgi:hypothetical protein
MNELVLSQLSIQLPQNSGARGKGKCSLKTGRLQSFAGYPISWCGVMTRKRGSKSKSAEAFVREMTKANDLEVRLSHSKVLEGEAHRLRSRPSWHVT